MSIKTVCKLFRSTSPRSIKRISASWFVTERLAIPKTSVLANQQVFYIAQKYIAATIFLGFDCLAGQAAPNIGLTNSSKTKTNKMHFVSKTWAFD